MEQSRDSIADVWGPRTPYHGEGQWPARVDHRIVDEPQRWVQSACVLCSNGCALDIGVRDGHIVGVRGREADVVNRGRLGPKGLHGWEANAHPDRLTKPLLKKKGSFHAISWEEAMDLIVRKTQEIRAKETASAIGFYTSGQLMLEEYYTIGVIGKAGLGTPHMDGNTRLCTATAAAALKESFGADGQPASYFDVDVAECIVLVGHNMASTDTVLWSRILDRRAGPKPPALIVIDPRRTPTSEAADLHLAPRIGTNVALLNGILAILIERDMVDYAFLEKSTVGYGELAATVLQYTPERVEKITGVAPSELREAAHLIGTAPTLLSTCLQGVYQSMQATAAAVQVNNINLVRGMIGKPGCGVLQMNGQPTAQNNRECGADGDLPGFRNWGNPEHIAELARIWNVDPGIIPHWAPPTHALEIFHLAETGSIKMLWISATNPAVSMPNLGKIRSMLERDNLFVIVQDAYMTETAQFADVVLPAAIWAEKTGTFTNVDRTVHISHQAINPPGEARSDLDIWLDYARRMNFQDKDGAPLIKWAKPEEAFEAWKICSRGRPCDYSGLSYEKLSGGSGIPWPCTSEAPAGSRRLYIDGVFRTDYRACESFGHDLITGAEGTPQQYRANNPGGRAILKPAEYQAPLESPDSDYPFMLTTGRVVYHFHTRTKTGRSAALADAAPDAFIQISEEDAKRLRLREGDFARATSRRGFIEATVRVGNITAGELFVPFHYGYWDDPDRSRAANEVTLYRWDAVSKQPHFKYAAVKLERISPSERSRGQVLEGKETTALKAGVVVEATGRRQHIADYLAMLLESEECLVLGFNCVKENHPGMPDIEMECSLFSGWSRAALDSLRVFQSQYGERSAEEPRKLEGVLIKTRLSTGITLVRDLHDLWLLANESLISIAVLKQAAQALRAKDFENALAEAETSNRRQLNWLLGRVKQAAPQALVVPS